MNNIVKTTLLLLIILIIGGCSDNDNTHPPIDDGNTLVSFYITNTQCDVNSEITIRNNEGVIVNGGFYPQQWDYKGIFFRVAPPFHCTIEWAMFDDCANDSILVCIKAGEKLIKSTETSGKLTLEILEIE